MHQSNLGASLSKCLSNRDIKFVPRSDFEKETTGMPGYGCDVGR